MKTASAERRLSSILVADVVGYSRMVGADETGTVDAIRSTISELIRPKAAQYRGRIVKLMGDGLLMEFASVVDAVLFAVELQGAMIGRNQGIAADRQIVYRVGINIGDIIVDGDDIQGDGVNIAARLESIADPGGILLSDAAFSQVRGKLDLTFEQLGEKQVKNFAEAVSVSRVVMDDKANSLVTGIEHPEPKHRMLPLLMAAGVALVALVGAIVWWQFQISEAGPVTEPETVLALPAIPSVAVLPFRGIGEDDKVDYFTSGLTNDLITDLSRFKGLFVSASNSVFAIREKAIPIKDAARELGVRYVLEGSAQQAGGKIRVNAQLIEAATEKYLWSERYDRDLTDVFAVQDEIVQRIIAVLTVKVAEAELQRSRSIRPANMQAYDYVLRGKDLTRRNTRADNFESQGIFQTAIEQDPGYALAYTALGEAVLKGVLAGWASDPRQALKRAHDLAQAAIGVESHAEGHALLGQVYLLMKHFDLSRAELDRALEMNPNDANSFAALGGVNLWTSNLGPAVKAFDTSMRLDPKSTPEVRIGLGTAFFLMQQYRKSLSLLEAASAQAPENLFTHMVLAAAYGEIGRSEDAIKQVAEIRKLHPFFKVAPYRTAFTLPEHGQRLANALTDLGLD